jgi:hypothetical protein
MRRAASLFGAGRFTPGITPAPAPASHPYFHSAGVRTHTDESLRLPAPATQHLSVIPATTPLKASVIPANTAFGLNSNRHLVRLESDVTPRKQTKDSWGRHFAGFASARELPRGDSCLHNAARPSPNCARTQFHSARSAGFSLRRRAQLARTFVTAGRSGQGSTRQLFRRFARSVQIPVATQLIISNRSTSRLETLPTPSLSTKLSVLIDTNVASQYTPARDLLYKKPLPHPTHPSSISGEPIPLSIALDRRQP